MLNNLPKLWNCRSDKLYVHLHSGKKSMQLTKYSKLTKLFISSFIFEAKLTSKKQKYNAHEIDIVSYRKKEK